MAGNDADAADGCQEALVAIVRGLPRFDERASFKTWSYRVATNACLDELRRRNRRPLPSDTVDLEVADPTTPIERMVDRDLVDGALAQLADEFRLPIVLRDLAGYDYADIAATLDIPPGTVRSRIARGRRQLSQILRNQEASGQRQTVENSNRPGIEPRQR